MMRWGVKYRTQYRGKWNPYGYARTYTPDGKLCFGFRLLSDAVAFVSQQRQRGQQWCLMRRTREELSRI